MKYIKLTQIEADTIGFYRINDWLAIDALAGKLKGGGYALPESVLSSLQELNKSLKIKGVDLSKKNKVDIKNDKFKKDEQIIA